MRKAADAHDWDVAKNLKDLLDERLRFFDADGGCTQTTAGPKLAMARAWAAVAALDGPSWGAAAPTAPPSTPWWSWTSRTARGRPGPSSPRRDYDFTHTITPKFAYFKKK